MNGPVGGRLEQVAPRAVTDSGDRRRLLALVLLSALVHVWLIANTAVTAKDSMRFARMALALWKPNEDKPADKPVRSFPDVLRAEKDPPGYPLALAAFYFPVKAVWPEPHSTVMDRALLAGQVASSLAALLTVFPMYWLGRLLFSKRVGFWAAGIFQCLPVYARESADALSDGPYLLFVALALLLAARGMKKPTVGRFLLAGLPVGVAFLVRPEGLLVLFPCMAAVPAGLLLLGRWPARTAAACLTALAVGTAIPAAPYVAIIGRLTNKPTFGGEPKPEDNPRRKMMMEQPKGAVAGPPFASWIPPDAHGAKRVGLATWESLKEWLKATHYSVGVLSVIGLVLLRKRLREDAALWIPLVYAGASVAAMGGRALVVGYVSERHGMPLALAGVFFAVAGMEPLWAWASRNALFWNGLFLWPRLTAAACALIMLSGGRQLLRPLHDNRVGHKYLGQALHEEFKRARNTDVLADPYGWVGFYSGWGVYNIGRSPDPAWTADAPLTRWAVLEVSTDADGNLVPDVPKEGDDRFPLALAVFNNDNPLGSYKGPQQGKTEKVALWPAADTGLRPRVVVVKQTLPPMPKQ